MWLLLIALPWQGVAAATMRHCAPSHPASSHAAAPAIDAAAPASGRTAQADATGHADPVGRHRHGGGADPVGTQHHPDGARAAHTGHGAASVPDDPSAADDAAPALKTGASAKCSACASCCVGAALPAATMAVPDGVPDAVPSGATGDAATGFVTDGPDRPPRPPLRQRA